MEAQVRAPPLTMRPCHWPENGGGNIPFHGDRESRKIPQTPRPQGWPKYEGDEDEKHDITKLQDSSTVTEKKVSFWQRLKRSVRPKEKGEKDNDKSKQQRNICCDYTW